MSRKIVANYFSRNWKVVIWRRVGDTKGPNTPGWPTREYSLEDYKEGDRVGILTGTEVSEGKFLHDIDIDWFPGVGVVPILPGTSFAFGRKSKRISHLFVTTDEPLPTFKYEDVDGTTLIELRGTKTDKTIGHMTMVPPSIWSKEDQEEPLEFVVDGDPGHLSSSELRERVCLTAISLILAKNIPNGEFNHDLRMAWAGFMLRAGFKSEWLEPAGKFILEYCGNKDVHDIATVLKSTERLLQEKSKVTGGPSLAKIVGKAVVARINTWLGRDSEFIRDKNGQIVKESQHNVRSAISKLGVELSYDEFADRKICVRKGKREVIDDKLLTRLYLESDEKFHFRPTFGFFNMVLDDMVWENPFHPVRDYLNSLKWDGVKRIATWLRDFGGAEDSPYLRQVSSIVLIAAVRRVREPGCKYDEMLVLEGSQGLSKSSALRALCPNDEWFSDDLALNVNAQKMIESTSGKWIVEAADLAGKRKAEVEQLKATLSRQVDGPARLAYARTPVERARQFIIIGTTNSSAYLNDATGARRFWPVRVGRFDVEGLKKHRDQLWAEAAFYESQNVSIRLPEEYWGLAELEQEERREEDDWEDIIVALLSEIAPGADGLIRVEKTAIWDVLGFEVSRRDRKSSTRINEIMHRLKYRRTMVRSATGVIARGYVGSPMMTPEERQKLLQQGLYEN